MLMAHKLLDAAWERDRKYTFLVDEGTPENVINNLLSGIAEADKFDFGPLLLEKTADDLHYMLPDLTTDERTFWIEGLVPLPGELCWYEYELGGTRSGLLVTDSLFAVDRRTPRIQDSETRLWTAQRVVRSGTTFHFDGVLLGIRPTEQDPLADTWRVSSGGRKNWQKQLDLDDERVQRSMLADIMVSIYLTLMINSRSTEIVTETAPPALNRSREKRGETPLFDHRVVRIVPIRYIRAAESESKRTHRPPRLHWRRSHVRTLHANTPQEHKIVIPRCIVGRADLGTISHEYKVVAPHISND